MRIWDLPCSQLCDKHLLGEHRELHCIWTFITTDKGGSYKKHPETLRWVGKLLALWYRHLEQVKEMEHRGWKHKSPINLKCGETDERNQFSFVNTPEEQIQILKAKGCKCNI